MSENKKETIFSSARIVAILFLISVVSAGVVAVVNFLTEDIIAANHEADIRKSFEEMFGEELLYKEHDYKPEGGEKVYEIEAAGTTYYCVNLNSPGFSGDIDILVSFDVAGVIKGVRVVSHSETPGIGSRVAEEGYTSLFIGKSSTEGIDSISGVTVSARALKAGISKAQALLYEAGLIGGIENS